MDPSRRQVLGRAAAAIAVAGAGVGGVGSALTACSRSGASAAPLRVVTAAGPRRSVYLGWTTALAQQVADLHPDVSLDVRRSSGSVENLRMVADGRAQLAVASADAAAVALRGESPFDQPVPVVALARVYDDYVHVLVRDDSAATRLVDLRGRPVAVGPEGSGSNLVARRLFEAAGVPVEDVELDIVEAGLALQGRRVDAVVWLGGLPTRAVTELAERVRLRLLPLTDLAPVLRARHTGAYRPAAIPPGTYGPDGVGTVAAANLLLAAPAVSGTVVDAVLDTAFERREAIAADQPAGNALDRRAAINTDPVPLHPAAARYYRARKP